MSHLAECQGARSLRRTTRDRPRSDGLCCCCLFALRWRILCTNMLPSWMLLSHMVFHMSRTGVQEFRSSGVQEFRSSGEGKPLPEKLIRTNEPHAWMRWSPIGLNSRLIDNRLFRAGVLPRRSVPVPGILATHRPRSDYG